MSVTIAMESANGDNEDGELLLAKHDLVVPLQLHCLRK